MVQDDLRLILRSFADSYNNSRCLIGRVRHIFFISAAKLKSLMSDVERKISNEPRKHALSSSGYLSINTPTDYPGTDSLTVSASFGGNIVGTHGTPRKPN